MAQDLRQAAITAATHAYAGYSHFRVGAAVLAEGTLYTGCNVENASYGLTMCAERVAVFKAISAGARRLQAVAVACVDADHHASPAALMPCGACLQVLAEFGTDDMPVDVVGAGLFHLRDLLPLPFRLG